ncbi:phosphoenolpyruvate carboxykinase (ATP) [Thermanaeromonas toyohensis]|nr:phosphoenolpyruvate carboxykinase (ATP) [Thermanaeromonas toyohensis]
MDLYNAGRIYRNLPVPKLIEIALSRGEGILAKNGALVVKTGKYTGRSPNDKYIVDLPSIHNQIHWGPVNQSIEPEKFQQIYQRLLAYLQNRELFIFDGFVGADPRFRLAVRVVNELAWQNLFVHQLFIRPTREELATHQPQFTVICAPGFKAEPQIDGTRSEAFIILNLEEKLILIGGTSYAGEMKKSIFTVMNYWLPQIGVLPMHCSANMGPEGDTALFFGLSGTGKTTLSADPQRRLIGDDEHGWSDQGIFNFEGGCYAKCISLSAENEPQIWNAIRFGAVLENVVVDEETRETDYDSAALTENTRAAYPVEFIPGAIVPGVGGHPRTILFLAADAFGVLPPIAKLTKEQAMYHFLSGYTSKLAGTERGVTTPEATFSTCFGAPFLPLSPAVYARMLGEKIDKYGVNVYLVNTGWSGGPYGVGQRMSIKLTRAVVQAALSGELEEVEMEPHPIFQILVPKSCPGVPAEVLQPRNTWPDPKEYDEMAQKLARLFTENFNKFKGVAPELAAVGPRAA